MRHFHLAAKEMNSSKISVFIVDNHPTIQQTLAASSLREADIKIVGIEKNEVKALKIIPLMQPFVVIMGLMIPRGNSFSAIRRLSQMCPQILILVIDRLGKDKSVFAAIQAGAKGYLPKGDRSR